MDHVKDQIKKAFKGSKKLEIKGYVSSKGQTADYTVEFIGYEGYRSLLQQSHDYINNLPRPEQFGMFDWAEATEQQMASWSTSLSGVSQRQSSVVLTPAEEGAYHTREDRPDAVVIQHLRLIDSQGVEIKQAAHRDGVTAAKAWIRENAPISKYLNMLILEPGKFTSVTAL
jgi:hypothetical protein